MGTSSPPNLDDPSPYPEVPYPWLIAFDPISASLRRDMRTVDPSPRPGPRTPEQESAYLIESAARVLDQITQAAQGFNGRTSLGFVHDSLNGVTGSYGVVIRRLISRGKWSAPLAELIVGGGPEDEANAQNEAKRLGWNAANRRLEMLVHTEPKEPNPRPAVFAVVRDEEDRERYLYLARLLVGPYEVTQWADSGLEQAADAIQ
jgi:hypothetical protein